MTDSSIIPVTKCKRCGKILVITHAHTFQPDENLELLHKVMAGAIEAALCKECNRKRVWYANQNRIQEWEAGLP